MFSLVITLQVHVVHYVTCRAVHGNLTVHHAGDVALMLGEKARAAYSKLAGKTKVAFQSLPKHLKVSALHANADSCLPDGVSRLVSCRRR